MSILKTIESEIRAVGQPEKVAMYQKFFQTGPGQYAEGDLFVAAKVPNLRKIAKQHYQQASLEQIEKLLNNQLHEVRFVALVMLTSIYQKELQPKKQIVDFYLNHTDRINHWDLVDVSAHKIIGDYTLGKPFPLLKELASSDLLWDRRIAVVATLTHSKAGNPKPILTLAEQLLSDPHDLMHKAIGWMLREMGKSCGRTPLITFLEENAPVMPRTMLRYAIEKLPKEERRYFLNLKG